MNPRQLFQCTVICTAAFMAAGCGDGSSSSTDTTATTTTTTTTGGTYDSSLAFKSSDYTTLTVTLDGVATTLRRYRIVYVAKPIEMALSQVSLMGGTTTLDDAYVEQTMYVTVKESQVSDQTAPIFMVTNNAGWLYSAVSASVSDGGTYVSTSDTDLAGAALGAGYVLVDVGTRGRGTVAADGTYAGKAPACIVDVKAAIRYLRLNDSTMPGSAERIVVYGMSGGGGLTSAVAATGNSDDYYAYLADIGAAGISGSGDTATSTLKDNIFAAMAYAPINNLPNADKGYEWQYNAIRSDSNTGSLGGVAYSAGPQPAASLAIAATFSGYLGGLDLTLDDGTLLTSSNMAAAITDLVSAEVVRKVKDGTITVPVAADGTTSYTVNGSSVANNWLTVTGTSTSPVVTIDYSNFLKFVTTSKALKTVVAFDAVGVTGNTSISGESNLFGTSTQEYSNFSAYSWDNNAGAATGIGKAQTGVDFDTFIASSAGSALAKQVKLVNPVVYLNSGTTDVAPYWYIRHGMVDRDTSFAMQTILYRAVKKDPDVKDVNFKFPWGRGHEDKYDVQEAFTWLKAKVAANPLE